MSTTQAEIDRRQLEAALAGDQRAFRVLVETYQRALFFYCRRFLHDDEEAADMVQRSFVRVFTHGQSFRGDASFKTWLYQIAGNLCRNELRRRGRRKEESLEETMEQAPHTAQSEPTALQSLLEGERKRLLIGAIETLPPRQRAVVTLRLLHHMSFAEIGEAESITANNAKVNFHHGVKRLKQVLRARGVAA